MCFFKITFLAVKRELAVHLQFLPFLTFLIQFMLHDLVLTLNLVVSPHR